ncbi:hypothetical protein ACFL0S_10745 [Thermodesulfobacteriota bacterium]
MEPWLKKQNGTYDALRRELVAKVSVEPGHLSDQSHFTGQTKIMSSECSQILKRKLFWNRGCVIKSTLLEVLQQEEGQGGFTVRGYPNTQVVRQLATGQGEYEPSAYQGQ